MKVLLTGAAGQLGRAFLDVAPSTLRVTPVGHTPSPSVPDLELVELEDRDAIRTLVTAHRPDWIVHAAAMTDVDGCERDPARAHRVNALATQALARAAAETGARMIYVSTDYVFDGETGHYVETDPVAPRSAYGQSKLEGERLAQAALPTVAIARTSVVFGPHKKNFVTWLLGELRAGRPVRIVEDQRVTPTFTYDLAEQLLALIHADAQGVWHTAGATSLSRLDMASAICDAFKCDFGLVTPVKSADLSWLAPRPLDSTLDTRKIARLKAPLTFPAALQRLQERLPA